MSSGATAEVGLVGREGMVGLSTVLGTIESLTTAVVQMPGTALKVSTATLRAARATSPSVRNVLDLYTEARLLQSAQSAACNRLHTVEARLARWILGIHDRIQGDEFTLPQQLIADVLGVQRPTISIALQRLHDMGVIGSRGRAVTITNRRGLETTACECYGVVRREFDRLLGRGFKGHSSLSVETASHAAHDQRGADTAVEALREIAGRLLLVTIREQEAREQADADDESKNQLVAKACTEMQRRLNAILESCATVGASQPWMRDRELQTIEREARAQLQAIEDLLDGTRTMSRAETLRRTS
jgi:hypothetical protein